MDKNTNTFMDRYMTPLSLLLAALIVAGAIVYGTGGKNSADSGKDANAGTVDINKVTVEGEPYIGDKNAKTTIALFYDYQCPFCKQFELAVNPQLIEKYVKDGKTKIVFKDFQFLGQDSDDAAVFGRALWESQPDKFYPWYVAMFTAQDDEGDQGFGDMASIDKLAATIDGLDVAKVDALVKEKRATYEQQIAASRAEGAALGINGTPSIIVGNQLFTGLSPEGFYTSISTALDAELK